MKIQDSTGNEVEVADGVGEVEVPCCGFDIVGKSLRLELNAGASGKVRVVHVPISQVSAYDELMWGVRLYIPFWLAQKKRMV